MKVPMKWLALFQIVAVLLLQRMKADMSEETLGKTCDLHYENAPDVSTLGDVFAIQTVPSITGAMVVGR
jgi:hypothetical protein